MFFSLIALPQHWVTVAIEENERIISGDRNGEFFQNLDIYALNTHLSFIVWKNHWNAMARFQDIKYFSLSSVKSLRVNAVSSEVFIDQLTQIS